jgi:hypothetical protein
MSQCTAADTGVFGHVRLVLVAGKMCLVAECMKLLSIAMGEYTWFAIYGDYTCLGDLWPYNHDTTILCFYVESRE